MHTPTSHTSTPGGRTVVRDRLLAAVRREAGEGVISTGIAVLIMALLGAAMWVAFSGVFDTTSDSIQENVECTTTNTCTDTTGGGTGD